MKLGKLYKCKKGGIPENCHFYPGDVVMLTDITNNHSHSYSCHFLFGKHSFQLNFLDGDESGRPSFDFWFEELTK